MRVAAFDIATKTGAADGSPGSVPRVWSWDLHRPGSTREQRFGLFLAYCDRYLAECLPDAVFYEAPLLLIQKGRGEAPVSVLRGLIAILAASASRAGVQRIQAIDPQQARRALLGASPAAGEGKQLVFERCRLLGWKPANLDESDAMAIWSLGCAMVNPRTAHLSTELFSRRR
jgi:hypothetical protein